MVRVMMVAVTLCVAAILTGGCGPSRMGFGDDELPTATPTWEAVLTFTPTSPGVVVPTPVPPLATPAQVTLSSPEVEPQATELSTTNENDGQDSNLHNTVDESADLEYAICPTLDDRCSPPFFHAHWSYEITFQKVK